MKVVKVEWIDSCASNHEWMLTEDMKAWDDVKPISISTWGVLVQEDANYIVVAQNYGTDPEQVCNLMSIPKGCIVNMTYIEEIDNEQ